MTTGNIYPLLDRLLDGQLAETLRAWRIDEGLSLQRIVVRLATEHEVEVSTDTVRRWLDDLGLLDRKGAA